MHTVTIRVRSITWFAAGIAIGLFTAAVFVGIRSQAADGDESSFVPITPCRLFDTRPASQVGLRNTPLGPDDTYSQQVTGTNGDCTIPDDATGIALNVTATNATEASFLTIWPDDQPRPLASSLNYLPGQPPAPNKVDVQLGATGAINLFNKNGSVHLIADATGYYTSHTLDDLRLQLERLSARLDDHRSWPAHVGKDKDSTGPYTVSPQGVGNYWVTYRLRPFSVPVMSSGIVPKVRDPIPQATSLCYQTTVSTWIVNTQIDGDYYDTVTVGVAVMDEQFDPANCSVYVVLRFALPDPLLIPAPF